MTERRFELLGHDNPFGVYPAPVVAVGRLDDHLVAVYAGEEAQETVVIDEDSIFVEHTDAIGGGLGGFDFRLHRLFAFSADRVVYYSIDEEEGFFRELLNTETLREDDPFLRLSLAKGTGSPEVIRAEMRSCLVELSEQTPFLIDSWYESQRRQLGKQLKAAIPGNWQEFLARGELRTHQAATLRERLDVTPSPEPAVPERKYRDSRVHAKRMSQSEVVNHFAEKFELKRAQVRELFEELSNLASSELRQGGEFLLPGFGKLVLSERKAREGRNPQTGETVKIPAKTTLKFRVSKGMKDAVVPKRK